MPDSLDQLLERARQENEETSFRSWYGKQVEETAVPGFRLDANPDAPEHQYDWRGAYRAGAKPAKDPNDGRFHWPSQFKSDDHPRRFLTLNDKGEEDPAGTLTDTKTMKPADPLDVLLTRARKAAADDEVAPASSDEQSAVMERLGFKGNLVRVKTPEEQGSEYSWEEEPYDPKKDPLLGGTGDGRGMAQPGQKPKRRTFATLPKEHPARSSLVPGFDTEGYDNAFARTFGIEGKPTKADVRRVTDALDVREAQEVWKETVSLHRDVDKEGGIEAPAHAFTPEQARAFLASHKDVREADFQKHKVKRYLDEAGRRALLATSFGQLDASGVLAWSRGESKEQNLEKAGEVTERSGWLGKAGLTLAEVGPAFVPIKGLVTAFSRGMVRAGMSEAAAMRVATPAALATFNAASTNEVVGEEGKLRPATWGDRALAGARGAAFGVLAPPIARSVWEGLSLLPARLRGAASEAVGFVLAAKATNPDSQIDMDAAIGGIFGLFGAHPSRGVLEPGARAGEAARDPLVDARARQSAARGERTARQMEDANPLGRMAGPPPEGSPDAAAQLEQPARLEAEQRGREQDEVLRREIAVEEVLGEMRQQDADILAGASERALAGWDAVHRGEAESIVAERMAAQKAKDAAVPSDPRFKERIPEEDMVLNMDPLHRSKELADELLAPRPEGSPSEGVFARVRDPDSGFTVNPATGREPTEGYAVSRHRDREMLAKPENVNIDAYARFKEANKDLLRDPNKHIGVWHDPETGHAVFDIVDVTPDHPTARKYATDAQQKAYYGFRERRVFRLDDPEAAGPEEGPGAHGADRPAEDAGSRSDGGDRAGDPGAPAGEGEAAAPAPEGLAKAKTSRGKPPESPLSQLASGMVGPAQALDAAQTARRVTSGIKRSVRAVGGAASRLYGWIQAKTFPKMTAETPETAARAIEAAASHSIARAKGDDFVESVLGKKATAEEDHAFADLAIEYQLRAIRKDTAARIQALEKERIGKTGSEAASLTRKINTLRPTVEKAQTVVGAEGSSFKIEADYQAALAKNRDAIARHVAKWNEPGGAEEIHRALQDVADGDEIAASSRDPFRVNLLTTKQQEARLEREKVMEGRPTSGMGKVGGFLQRRSTFAKRATGLGEYHSSYRDMMRNTFEKQMEKYGQKALTEEAVRDGAAQWVKFGETPPEEIQGRRAVAVPVYGLQGKWIRDPMGGEKPIRADRLYLREDYLPEFRAAIGEESRSPVWGRESVPARVSDAAAQLALAGPMDNFINVANDVAVAVTAPRAGIKDPGLRGKILRALPGVEQVAALTNVARYFLKRPADFTQRRLELAKHNAWREREPMKLDLKTISNPISWISAFGRRMNESLRLVLDDAYTQLVKEGAPDTPTARSQFINRAGMYNPRAMDNLTRGLRSTLSNFIVSGKKVAGTGLRLATMDPGFPMEGMKQQVAGRALVLAKWVGFVSTWAAMQSIVRGTKTGNWTPATRDGVPILALDLYEDDEQGRPKYIDTAAFNGTRKALNILGVGGAVEATRRGLGPAEALDAGFRQAANALLLRWVNGPLTQGASIAMTGKPLYLGAPSAAAAPGETESATGNRLVASGVNAFQPARFLISALDSVLPDSWSVKERFGLEGDETTGDEMANLLAYFGTKKGVGNVETLPERAMYGKLTEWIEDRKMALRKVSPPNRDAWVEQQIVAHWKTPELQDKARKELVRYVERLRQQLPQPATK